MATTDLSPQVLPSSGLVTLTHVLYGMHAFRAVMGMLGPMFVVTAFLTGWPSIIAIIMLYRLIRGWLALLEGRAMPVPVPDARQ